MGRLQKKKVRKKNKTKHQSKTAPKKVPSKKSVKVKETKKPDFVAEKSTAAAKVVKGVQKKSYFEKSVQFLREVKIEFKKVTWPSRKQTIGSTAAVILLVIIISLFLGIIDVGLSNLIRVILN
mmetsp:Transcript_444/g.253  ORF Transcript_444/g.253 Transcript_444/m.253 type:complete len:123 (+) Transcript_444:201-569(+)